MLRTLKSSELNLIAGVYGNQTKIDVKIGGRTMMNKKIIHGFLKRFTYKINI